MKDQFPASSVADGAGGGRGHRSLELHRREWANGMLTWIVTDSPSSGNRLRQLMTKWEYTCPAENILSMENAGRTLVAGSAPAGIILITLSASPERGLTALRELRPLRVPVIVIGPRDPKLILDAMHAGAGDYVEDSESLDIELALALQRLNSRQAGRAPRGRLFAVTAAGGGNGRSVVAVNLSILLAKKLGSCCLIDLDPMGGVCASLLNLNPRHNVLDLAQQPEKLDRNSFEQSLVEHESGVRLLAGASDFVPPDLFGAEFLERLVSEARALFPAVVLDLHNVSSEVTLRRLQSSQFTLILVSRLDFNAICYTGRALEYWERMGIPRKSVQLVANRLGQANEVPIKKMEQVLSLHIKHKLPEASALVNQSINTGVPLVIEEPYSVISKSLAILAADLLGETTTAVAPPHVGTSVLKSSLSPFVRFGSFLTRQS